MRTYTHSILFVPLFFCLLLAHAQKESSFQDEIESAFQACFRQKNARPLLDLDKTISAKATSDHNYWRAYLHYHLAVYLNETNKKTLAEAKNDLGIALLVHQKIKSSEDYALLALMESFSIPFKKEQVLWIAPRVQKNARKALEMDSLNLRAYFVLGSNDFYTPKLFGGMKKAEQYLKKAVALGKQNKERQQKPTWGHNSSYELLVKLLLKQKEYEKAKKWAAEGAQLYPDHFPLKKLNKRFTQD